MNRNQRQQLLGWVALLAVVLLVADRLVLTPLGRFWAKRSDRIGELKKLAAQGPILLDREALIRERWEAMQANVLSNEVSSAENQLLSALDRWSEESRIGISSVRPQWKRGDPLFSTLECRVDAFGNLAALTRFLYDIERDPLALKVDRVEITARDDKGEQLTLALQLSGLLLKPAVLP